MQFLEYKNLIKEILNINININKIKRAGRNWTSDPWTCKPMLSYWATAPCCLI